MNLEAPEPTVLSKINAAGLYAFASTVAILLNKILMNTYEFRYPVSMIFFQNIATLSIVGVLTVLRVLPASSTVKISVMLRYLPVALLFGMNAILGVAALRYTSVGMFSVLRRLTVLFAVISEYLVFSKVHSRTTWLSIILMMTGALVAGASDLSFRPLGYVLVFGNNMTSTLLQIANVKLAADLKLQNHEVLVLQSLLAFPVCGLIAYFQESEQVLVLPQWNDYGFALILIAASSWIPFLNYSTLYCTRTNSVLTTDVVGQMKNLLVVAFGWLLWPSDRFSMLGLFGFSLSLGGSVWYSFSLFRKQET